MLRIIAKFAGGNLVGQGLTVASGLILARFVGPEVLGLFASLSLVQGYAPWLLLGTGNGLGREIPYALGQGDRPRAEALAAAAGTWTLAVASVCAAALLIVAGVQAVRGHWELAVGWLVQALTVWAILFSSNYLQFMYRTSGEFGRLAQIIVGQGVVGLLGVAAAVAWGFLGLCARSAVQALAQLAMMWHWRPMKVRPTWSSPDLWHLMKVGLPIMFVGQMSVWWGTLNDTLVLTQLDQVQLGLNAVVVMATRPFMILVRAAATVVYPRMTQEFARTGNLRQAVRVAGLPAVVLLPSMVVLVGVSWWLMPLVVPPLLPKYAAAVPAMQWSLLSLIPYSLSSFNNIFAASGRMVPYIVAIVSGMLAYILALYWLLPGRPDLVSFAQAMVIGKTVFLLVSFLFIGLLLRQGTVPARRAVSILPGGE